MVQRTIDLYISQEFSAKGINKNLTRFDNFDIPIIVYNIPLPSYINILTFAQIRKSISAHILKFCHITTLESPSL